MRDKKAYPKRKVKTDIVYRIDMGTDPVKEVRPHFSPVKICSDRHGGKEKVHDNKVAGASKHDKYMKNFMRTEVLMSGVKDRKL